METQINCSDDENSCEIECDEDDIFYEEEEDEEEDEDDEEDENDEPSEEEEEEEAPIDDEDDMDKILISKYKKEPFKTQNISSSSSSSSSKTEINKNDDDSNSDTDSSASLTSLEWNEDQKLNTKSQDIESGDLQKVQMNEENQLNLSKICHNGQTFLWDLLISDCSSDDTIQDDKTDSDTTEISSTSSSSSINSNLSNRIRNISQNQHQKVLKEAEKQLQTLLCLPSTDKRIRLKFIESCLSNLKSNRACVFSLRLLTKLFSSFQQYSNNTNSKTSITDLSLMKSALTTVSQMQEQLLFNTSKHNSFTNNHLNSNIMPNITEVHRIVALTEYNYAMMNIFFESLKLYANEQIQRLDCHKSKECKI